MHFGGIRALDRLSFTIDQGQICGLIGPNGAGKTTIFNVISRIYAPSEGTVTFAGDDLLRIPPHRIAYEGIFRTFQNVALWPRLTVIENVMIGAHSRTTVGFARAPFRINTRGEERRVAIEAYDLLDELGLAACAFHPAAGLPFGTLKRIELARALAGRPKLLMLDEPANGLTHQEVLALGDLVKAIRDRYELTVLLVEHHMALVNAISDKVVAMDFGAKIAEGPPREVAGNARVIEAYLGTPA